VVQTTAVAEELEDIVLQELLVIQEQIVLLNLLSLLQ
jgi:hypothetical protein